jgi:hypothetical protein
MHFDRTFLYSSEDLRIPFHIYTLRKKFKNDDGVQARLDNVFGLIVRNDLNAAVDILNTMEPLPAIPRK